MLDVMLKALLGGLAIIVGYLFALFIVKLIDLLS